MKPLHIFSIVIVFATSLFAGDAVKPPVEPPAEVSMDIRDMLRPAYLLELAEVHLKFGAVDRASELLAKAETYMKAAEDEFKVYYLQGSVLAKKKEYAEAAKKLEEALKTAPGYSDRAQAGNLLVEVYVKLGQAERAQKLQKELSVVVAPGPARDEPLERQRWMNLLQEWRGNDEKLNKTISDLETAIAQNPKDAKSLESLADVYTVGRHDAVKLAAILEKLLVLKPKDDGVRGRLGQAYEEQKKYDQAMALYEQMLRDSPRGTGQGLHLKIAYLLLASGDKDKAAKYAAEHLAGSDNAAGTSVLAMFYQQAGMLKEAAEVLNKLVPNANTPKQKMQYMQQLADVSVRLKEYPKAEELLRSILKDFKEDKAAVAQAKNSLVWLYQEQNRMNELKFEE